jgi:hypothetical protein
MTQHHTMFKPSRIGDATLGVPHAILAWFGFTARANTLGARRVTVLHHESKGFSYNCAISCMAT